MKASDIFARFTIGKKLALLLAAFLALQILQLGVGISQVRHVAEEAEHLGGAGRLRPAFLAEIARRRNQRTVLQQQLLDALAAQDDIYQRLDAAYGKKIKDPKYADIARSATEAHDVWEKDLRPLIRSVDPARPEAARASLARYAALFPAQAVRLTQIVNLLEQHLNEEILVTVRNHVSIFVLSLLLAFIAAWDVRRRAITPLRALAKASQAIAGGDLGQRLSIASSDEIGQLVGAFNDMATNLEVRRQQVDTAVAELLKNEEKLHKEAKERQQAEAQLRLFIESSGQGILGLDLGGRCTLANPEAVRLLGYRDAGELLGRDFHGTVHCHGPDASPDAATKCQLCTSLAGAEAAHAEDETFQRADGTSFPVEYHARPLLFEDRPIGAVVVFTDISERKRQEERLRKLSRAVEHGPAAMITDSDGRIEYVNPRFTELTGYQPEEVIGGNPRLWQSGSTPPKTYQRLWSAIKAGQAWQGELLNKTKDGRLFWEEIHISPIADEYGRISHFVAILENITTRKEQEEQVWRQAHYDNLTGLPNRGMFRERLEQAMAGAERGKHHIALLYLDLDGFKPVNDTYGHDAGDELLRQVARRLGSALRDNDTAARLGGDEFAVNLSPLSSAQGAEVVATKLIASLRLPYEVQGKAVAISCSIGIAMYPDDAENAEMLIRLADLAMYEAKQQERGGYRFYRADGGG